MFKLESYITPFIIGYIDKYVKLRHEDFQLSLWGGDAVLNKLDLRLEAIEEALQLPITVKSGHIHELRIHVPWTKLGSEPVVITVNTIECVLKVTDSASDDQGSTKSADSGPVTKVTSPKQQQQQTPEQENLPPGYLQGYIKKIMNNVNILVNNLILKFVEEDVVLSLNVKSAELYTVGGQWKRSFADIQEPELVLRRLLDLQDLTVCLDKRNASGKIDTYQDPLIYRCGLTCRIHSSYESLHSRLPYITKISVLCEKLNLSLTDVQVPMFVRLLELVLAVYYGAIGQKTSEGEDRVPASAAPLADLGDNLGEEAGDGSWSNWVWSYVPQILPEEEGQNIPTEKKQTIFSLGLYCTSATVLFKLTELVQDQSRYTPYRMVFKPCIRWEAQEIGFDLLIQGVNFVNVQFGLGKSQLFSEGEAICGMLDITEERDSSFFRSGQISKENQVNYRTDSLFDANSPENNGKRASFCCELERHLELYNENYALQKYGTLYVDYCYSMVGLQLSEGERLSLTREGQVIGGQEAGMLRVLVSPAHLIVSSSMVQRVHKLLHSMQHDYQPYFTPKLEKPVQSDSASPEVLQELEEHTSTVTMHLTLFCPSVLILPNTLPKYDVAATRKNKLYKSQRKATLTHSTLPGLLLQAQRMDFQLNTAMFPKTLVQAVSTCASPSRNLLQHCYAHKNIKIFGLEAGFTQVGEKGQLRGLCNLWQPCSGALYISDILLPKYWQGAMQVTHQLSVEIPQVSLTVRSSQLMLLHYMLQSWSDPSPDPRCLLATSLMQDALRPNERHLVLELGSVELKHCVTSAAVSASCSLASISLMLNKAHGAEGEVSIPVLRGPQNTSDLHSGSFLHTRVDASHKERELLTCTLQAPTQPTQPQAVGVVIVSLEGLVVLLEPELDAWLSYKPQYGVINPNGDIHLGQNASYQTDVASGSNDTIVTSMETPSLPPTHSRSCSQNVEFVKAESEETQTGFSWREFCARYYPLVKITEMQVDIAPVCAFLSEDRLQWTHSDWEVASSLHTLYQNEAITGCLCVCLPAVHLNSLAHRRMAPTQELPIRVTELSIAGEKLPWLLKVMDASVYCIHGPGPQQDVSTGTQGTAAGSHQRVYSLLSPASVKATLAVSSAYFPPVSQHLSSLGLAIHADSKDLLMSLSQKQVELLHHLVGKKSTTFTEVAASMAILESICKRRSEGASPANLSFTRADILGKQSIMSSSSQVDPVEGLDVEFRTVTSETGSLRLQNVTRGVEDEGDGGVKLSLWLQCTVMQVQFKIYTSLGPLGELKVSLDGEEMSCSVDVTQVYSKVITKVTALSLRHCVRCAPGPWAPGSYDGILLTSSETISRNTYLSGEKAEKLVTMEPKEVTSEPDPSHSFLTITVTKALKKNVRRKLLLDDLEEVLVRSQKPAVASASSLLTEIVVQMNPVDFVLNVPVIMKTVQGLVLKDETLSRLRKQEVDPVDSEEPLSAPPPVSGTSYPLLYLNTKTIRVFVPCTDLGGSFTPLRSDEEMAGIGQSDSGIVFEKQTTSRQQTTSQTKETTSQSKETSKKRDENLLIFEVCSIEVSAQPENPLPRSVVDKHLYKKALQSGILRIPGSDIEDRQYQLDFNGCSITSGVWEELIEALDKRKPELSAVQNPALEWNNKSSQKPTESVQLTPVASNINVRVTAAPAMFYTPHPHKARVVCGHSLELNSRNDIDFFLATSQMRLGYACLKNNFNIPGTPQTQTSQNQLTMETERSKSRGDVKLSEVLVDSPVSREEKSEARTPKSKSDGTLFEIPVDILLTAGRISIVLYSDDIQLNAQLLTQYPGAPAQTLPREQYHQSSSTLDSAMFDTDRSSVKHQTRDLVPLVLVQFSQPHSLVSLAAKSQKLELSCYDLGLKGSAYKHCRSGSLPDIRDYNTDLLVTKPGHADEKTGISPCLYTFRATDFLKEPAKIHLVVERAMKVNVNCKEVEKMMNMCKILQTECFQTEAGSCRNETDADKEAAVAVGGGNVLNHLGLVSEVDVTTKQICTVLECSSVSGKHVRAMISLNELEANVSVLKAPDSESQVSGFINLYSLYTTVTSDGVCKPLLGPTSPSLRLSMAWDHMTTSGSTLPPRSVLAVKTGDIPIRLSQMHCGAIQALVEGFSTIVQPAQTPPSVSTDTQAGVGTSWWAECEGTQRSDEADTEQTSDDLRSGQLQYVSLETHITELPDEGEVLFSNNFGVGEAGLAWCYPRARVVTHLKSAPLPLNMPLNFRPDSVNQQLLVPCELQFWSELSQRYEVYAHFSVSEQKGFELDLSENSPPKAAKIWRVLIKQPLQNHAGYVLLQRHSETSSVATEEEDYIMVNRPDQQFIEPLVSPLTVAASLQVSSCYRRQCVPLLQLGLTAETLRVMLASQTDDCLPAKLALYQVQPSHSTQGHDVITLGLHGPSVAVSYTEGRTKALNCQLDAGVAVQVLEQRFLCKLPLLPRTDVSARLNYLMDRSTCHSLEGEVTVAPFLINVGPSLVHSLCVTMALWTKPASSDLSTFYEPFLLCNDTQEDLILGQTDTEESLLVCSRQARLYSWTHCESPQTLQIRLAQHKASVASDPFPLEVDRAETRTIVWDGHAHTFIVDVRKLTNLQKQVVIRSTFLLSSRVSETLELKLALKRGGHHVHKLQPEATLPSHTLQPADLSALKLRLDHPQALWSQEVGVTRDAFKGGKLVKIPSLQSDSFIHVWCHVFQKTYGEHTQTMVIFSPLFVFKSEMPLPLVLSVETPRLKKHLPLELPGRSTPAQLPSIAGDMIHNVSFRISHNMKPSNPVIQLSSGMIEQVGKVELDNIDAEELAYNWRTKQPLCWPYNELDKNSRFEPRNAETSSKAKSAGFQSVEKQCVSLSDYSGVQTLPQPTQHSDIDLQVELSQCWPGCKTLLITVAPHILICNECDVDLWFIVSSETHWKLPARTTWAPPQIEGSFRLGLIVDHELHLSDILELSEEDNQARYLPAKKGLLYTESHTNVTIPVLAQSYVTEMCYLTLHSTIHQNIRILTVRERLAVNNQTGRSLSVLQYNVPRTLNHKVTVGSEQGTDIPAESSDSCQALLFWRMNPRQQQTELAECVQYILLRGGGDSAWSCPVRLPLQSPARQSVSVCCQGGEEDVLMSVVSQTSNGIVYLVLTEEQPQLVLHNDCEFNVHFAEAVKDTSPIVRCEEQELIDRLPVVAAGRSVKYTFPSQNKALSDTGSKEGLPPKLHFSVCEHLQQCHKHGLEEQPSPHSCKQTQPLEWSVGVDIRYNSFVTIPGSGDIKIHTEEIGKTTFVYLSTITREEISAKEIRSRIKNSREAILEAKVTSNPAADVAESGAIIEVRDGKTELEKLRKPARNTEYWQKCAVSFSVTLQQAACSLICEDDLELREVLRLTLDHACVLASKTGSCFDKGHRRPSVKWEVLCGVADLQLDNQVQKVGSYDFPVVLIKQNRSEERPAINDMSVSDKIEFFKTKDVFCIEMCFVTDLESMVTSAESTTVRICPVNLFVEDMFVYFVLQNVELLIPVMIPSEERVDSSLRRRLPSDVARVALQFACPIVMRNLVIQPFSMNASVHASMKLFLAIDNSPLSFGGFERVKLCATSQHLVRAITMHYASGALFRAGWVVGSLELIGNPTHLLRSVALGVSDLVSLPYRGLTQGPGAFVSGVTHGMASFLKHVSSGTILSITNFASSVSRNMERLSLDSDHRHRQEVTRRNRPEGLSAGLKQGLTGFGLSVLGAVAGIADQPLQIFTRPDGDKTTSNVMVGVGRGLVGVLTKPVGGAAEFVSQTGIGLLQGTGLVRYPVPRAKQQTVGLAELWKQEIHYKLLSECFRGDSVIVAMAVELLPSGRKRGCFLVLSEAELTVIDEENPGQKSTVELKHIQSVCSFGSTLYVNHEKIQENKLESTGHELTEKLIESFLNTGKTEDCTKSEAAGHQLTEDRIKAFVIGASSGGASHPAGKLGKSKKSAEDPSLLSSGADAAKTKLVFDLNQGFLWFQELFNITLTAAQGFGFKV